MKHSIRTHVSTKEIYRFLVGGGSAVLIDAGVYVMLKTRIDFSLAKVISYIIGATVGFVINKLWTFECKGFNVAEILKYAVLYVFSAYANAFVNRTVLLVISSTIFAFLCATGTSTVLNFIGQKFLVFRTIEK